MIYSFFEELRREGRDFLSALFPEKCIACRKEGSYLCKRHDELPPAPKNEARFTSIDHVQATTAYYNFVAKQMVEFLKFRGFQSVGEFMTEKIVEQTPRSFWHHAVIVPIPLHWTRKFWRGFNQADILAMEIAKLVTEIEIVRDLKRKKRTRQQAKLSKVRRAKNIQDVFVWESKQSIPKRVILIDDVVASGSTLDSAGKVLKKAGVQTVDAVVFARGGGKEKN